MEPPQDLVPLEASDRSLLDLAQPLIADAEHRGDLFARVRALVGHVERAVSGGLELVLRVPAAGQVIAAFALLARACSARVTARCMRVARRTDFTDVRVRAGRNKRKPSNWRR